MEVTASVVVRLAEKLEDESSKFYTSIAQKYDENREIFQSFAKENDKNRILLTRTYQETVTDALETGFSFKSLKLDEYRFETMLKDDFAYRHALGNALKLEKQAYEFYVDIAERSKSLLGTIPRIFRKIAESRNRRRFVLEEMLEAKNG